MPVKFEQNCMYGPNYTKFWAFWQRQVFYNHFWQRVDAILEVVSVAEIIF